MNSVIPIEELSIDLSTIRELEIEWISTAEPSSLTVISGEAIYRSLPTQLQGNSTLSFSYQLSSDFSSISTDVILNSSETRRVWSSESAAINPSEWNIAVAPITLAYASTAEIIFRGVVAVEDVLYLKTIALRDYTQESTVGVVEYIRATGGMIYLEINTAESIPEPVWYRVYVKTLNSNESPALRFTGDGLQYLGANDEVAVLTNGVKVADGRLSKDNCNIPAYAYLQLGRDTMDVRSDASVLQGAMDEVRIWKVARDMLAVNASYQRNIADTDLILRLPFNSAEKTNWFPSGTDESGNSVDFMVQNVSVINTRPILAFGVAGDGSCFYKLTSAEVDVLPASTCDKACGDGSMKTCGSSISSKLHVVTSVYGKGPLGVGGLSPLVDYDIYVEFVSEDGGEYDITRALIASTSNTTVPGKVEYISVVERSDQSLEIRWSPVDDNGGSVILSYLVFMNGVQMEGTSDGTTLSVTLSIPEMQTSYNVTVQARNAFGLGPYSDSILLAGVYSEPSPEIPQRPNISFVSGGTVELVLDDTTVLAVDKLLSVVVIEHREISLTFFTKSFYRRNGTSATVYKLRHNTAYVFRIALASKSGIQSAFSIPISVRTGNRGMPRKTPVPLATKATGGSITLTMEEPLDTGGLPIARYNIFMLQDNLFSKITSVEASSTNEITSTTVTRDVDDVPLRALTDYTFKVLALQADVVCDTLTEEGLESDAVTKSTGFAAIPAPPSRPSLLQLAGCTAVITATPPNDYGGTQVTGMTVGVFLSTGVLYASFAVALDAGTITVPSLLANTSYFVKVSLKTTVGDSEFGEAQSFTTGEPSQPGKFARLKIDNIGSSSLSLSWAGPLNSGGGTVSGYLVYQRTSTSSELVYNGSDDSNTTSYLIRGLLAETLYEFAVVGINQYGITSKEDENVINATTSTPEVPAMPTNVKESDRIRLFYVFVRNWFEWWFRCAFSNNPMHVGGL
ncbi:hypothetical protein PRIC1_009422 [Phytophthora ramorum]